MKVALRQMKCCRNEVCLMAHEVAFVQTYLTFKFCCYTIKKGDTMKKTEVIELINTAAKSKDLCNILFKYNYHYSYHFPLLTSDKLFLSANEDDFIIDGFSVRRFCDIKKAEVKDDKFLEIIKREGVLDNIKVPEIDITDWYSVFLSLSKLNINIIVEKENLNDDECEFAIGKIIKVLKTKVVFKHFDADGIWQDENYEIPYFQITSVTFLSRYINVFSKYL